MAKKVNIENELSNMQADATNFSVDGVEKVIDFKNVRLNRNRSLYHIEDNAKDFHLVLPKTNDADSRIGVTSEQHFPTGGVWSFAQNEVQVYYNDESDRVLMLFPVLDASGARLRKKQVVVLKFENAYFASMFISYYNIGAKSALPTKRQPRVEESFRITLSLRD